MSQVSFAQIGSLYGGATNIGLLDMHIKYGVNATGVGFSSATFQGLSYYRISPIISPAPISYLGSQLSPVVVDASMWPPTAVYDSTGLEFPIWVLVSDRVADLKIDIFAAANNTDFSRNTSVNTFITAAPDVSAYWSIVQDGQPTTTTTTTTTTGTSAPTSPETPDNP